jgi:cold shock CspA family protein
MILATAAFLLAAPLLGQDSPPTRRGTATAYEADVSITVTTQGRGDQVQKSEFSIVKDRTKIEFGVGRKTLDTGAAVSVWADPENPKNALKILVEPGTPTLRGTVEAYEPDVSITIGIRVRGGQSSKTEFSIVKGETQVELGAGVTSIEPGRTVSVWAEQGDRKKAAKILAEPEPPTVKGTVTAYEANASITVESRTRDGEIKTQFSLAKDKTQIDLGGAKALEVGATVWVWAEKGDAKAAARIAVQGAPARRGPRGAATLPADPKPMDLPDAGKVLEAYKANLPSDKQLDWYTLDWVNTLGEAKERAAKEKRPILWIQTNKEGDLFCSLC